MNNNNISNQAAHDYVSKIYAITTTVDGSTTIVSNVNFFKEKKDAKVLSLPELKTREAFLDSVTQELEKTKREIELNPKLSNAEIRIITDFYKNVEYKVDRARVFILEAFGSKDDIVEKLNQAFKIRQHLTDHLSKYVQATYKKGADSVFREHGMAPAAAEIGVLSDVIARIDHLTKEQIKEYTDKIKSVVFPAEIKPIYKHIVEARNQVEKEFNEFGVEVEAFKALFVELKEHHENVVYKDQISKEKWMSNSTEQFDEELKAVIGEEKPTESRLTLASFYYSAAKNYAQTYFNFGF